MNDKVGDKRIRDQSQDEKLRERIERATENILTNIKLNDERAAVSRRLFLKAAIGLGAAFTIYNLDKDRGREEVIEKAKAIEEIRKLNPPPLSDDTLNTPDTHNTPDTQNNPDKLILPDSDAPNSVPPNKKTSPNPSMMT